MKKGILIFIVVLLVSTVTAVPLPFAETFDSATVPADWIVDPIVAGDSWEVFSSTYYGAAFEHTGNGGNFMAVDDSPPDTVPAHLYAPPIELTGAVAPFLTFYYWIGTQTTASTLNIDVDDGTTVTTDVAVFGETIDHWAYASIDLGAWIGQTITIDFRAMESINQYVGDICLDDVAVADASIPPAATTLVAPADLATDVTVFTDLEWNSATFAEGYYLYLGTDNPPTNMVNGTDLGDVTVYDVPALLSTFTMYYWQIVPWNIYGSAAACPIWSFETGDFVFETLPLVEDFETGAPGWASGTLSAFDTWEIAEPLGLGTSFSGTFFADPLEDHSDPGTYCVGTDLTVDGDYENLENSYIMTPILDCTAAPSVELTFWRYLNCEANYDEAYVEVSNDGGTNWIDLGQPLYIQDSLWTEVSIDVSAFAAGYYAQFRWRIDSDSSFPRSGWNIDDVSVYIPTPFAPPENVMVDEETALLTWQAPTDALIGYNVYLDGVQQNTALVTDLFYQFVGLVLLDTYLAGVSAVYDDPGESEVVEYQFTYQPTTLDPPNNLLVNEDGYATWELPGGGPQDIFSDDFESGLGNWTVVNNATGEWLIYSYPYPNGYQLPPAAMGTTVCAADADENYPIDCELILQTALDLTGFSTVTLEFDNDFNAYNINDWAYVDVSNDFGATWINLIAWNADVSESHEVVDITSYAAGSDGVQIRFYSVQPDWDFWWAIDNIYIHGIATDNDLVLNEKDRKSDAVNKLDNGNESSRDLLGYNVYLDTSFITYITDLFYQYTGLVNGQTYWAQVTAVYDEGESLPAEYSFTYIDNNPIIQVSPLTINETLDSDEQVVVPVTISNLGTGDLIYDINVSLYPLIPYERNNYLHSEPAVVRNNGIYDEIDPNCKIVEFPSNTDDQFDVQLAVPTGVGGGEAGFETDGVFMYTAKWNGAEFYRYDMDGNYLETFTIAGVSSVRDMAYDGTYFYGAAANTSLFQMDFTPGQETLISTISAPVSCRAIAYDSDENGFWANNFSTDMTLFDMNGNVLNSFPCGTAQSFYGLAYDNFSAYGPYLWGFSQSPPNAIVQFDIATGLETGLSFDVGAAVGSSGSAGGLFIEPNIFPGTVSIGCLIQNEWLVLLELADYADPWLYCDVYNGTIPAGQSATVNVTLDAADLADIVKEGYLTIESNGGADEIVEVTMNVNPILPPTNFAGTVQNFNDVLLTWDPPAVNTVNRRVSIHTTKKQNSKDDSINPVISRRTENRDESRALLGYTIYQDGTVIGTVDVNTLEFLYEALDAGTYNYTIVANYDEGDSDPAGPVEITITLPAPANVTASSNWPNISLTWNAPTESRDIDSYNVYQDNVLITNTTETSYEHENVPAGTYIYNVAVVYDGNWEGELSEDAEVVHENPNGVDPNLIPMITTLEGNFPNPFNPTTTIKFDLHEDQQVAIIIYNIKGEKVRTLVNDEFKAGYYNKLWNGKNEGGKSVSSGVYFYKMKSGDYQKTRKMILMK